jgi:hypothetical protein
MSSMNIDLAERDVFSFDGARCDRIVANVVLELASNEAGEHEQAKDNC